MRKNLSFIIFIALVCLAVYIVNNMRSKPGTSVSHDMVVQNIEALGKLELVRYNIQNVVEYERARNWLPNAKTLLVAVGEAVACIDLSKVKPGDIYVKNDSISIVLPAPELCYCRVDHQRSRIYRVDYGLWETADLVDDAYRHAERQLYIEVGRLGYEEETKANARKLLVPILNSMGFGKINMSFKTVVQDKENLPELH